MDEILVSKSPMSEFKLEESSINFHSARISLSHDVVKLVSNVFVGNNGSIEVGRGSELTSVEHGQVFVNKFHGVNLVFTGKTPNFPFITLRNNDFTHSYFSAEQGGLYRCGQAADGLAAGCDPRAVCMEPTPGNVQCHCARPLVFKAGFIQDGSKCELA